MRGRIKAIAAVLMALALGGADTAKPLRTLVPGTLRVGTYFVNPPFEYVAKGADVGYEVDLMEEIGRRLGVKPNIKVYPFDRIEEAMTDLDAGRITAVMKVAPVAAWLAAKNLNLRIAAKVPDNPQPLGIGFGKNQPTLVAAVNGALAAMQRDGVMNQLKKKWAVP